MESNPSNQASSKSFLLTISQHKASCRVGGKVYYKEKYKDQSDLDKPGKNPISLKILPLFYI